MTVIILLIALLSFGFGYFYGYFSKTKEIDREIEAMDGEELEDLHENCHENCLQEKVLRGALSGIYGEIRTLNKRILDKVPPPVNYDVGQSTKHNI